MIIFIINKKRVNSKLNKTTTILIQMNLKGLGNKAQTPGKNEFNNLLNKSSLVQRKRW